MAWGTTEEVANEETTFDEYRRAAGRIDGRLGAKTRQALISFQQKNGLQASGRIDSQTVTKLGVDVHGSGQSTTGQDSQQGDQRNMPSRDQRQQGRQDQHGGRDGNAPDAGGRSDQRSEQDRNSGNAPSTTGQGSQQGGERGNMPSRDQGGNTPKGKQDGGQKGTPSNRDREK